MPSLGGKGGEQPDGGIVAKNTDPGAWVLGSGPSAALCPSRALHLPLGGDHTRCAQLLRRVQL